MMGEDGVRLLFQLLVTLADFIGSCPPVHVGATLSFLNDWLKKMPLVPGRQMYGHFVELQRLADENMQFFLACIRVPPPSFSKGIFCFSLIGQPIGE